jgi:hypothetical protein
LAYLIDAPSAGNGAVATSPFTLGRRVLNGVPPRSVALDGGLSGLFASRRMDDSTAVGRRLADRERRMEADRAKANLEAVRGR